MKVNREVDVAMADERPAKQAVRELWVKQYQDYNKLYPGEDVPLYLTLCGAEARDIKLLAERGLIKLTETGGIATESQNRIIAIERSNPSALVAQRQHPGMKIIVQDFKSFIAGDTLIRYPLGEHEKYCCARIINLDFQESLAAIDEGGSIGFPVLTWIRKLSQIHAEKKPQEEWCLCLTLNSSLGWSQAVTEAMQRFLADNFQRSPAFADSCKALLSHELYNKILDATLLDMSALSQEEQQKFLMIFVPKKIAQLVHAQHWRVNTSWNLRYGGIGGHAAMVTWVFTFLWDVRASSRPDEVYKDSLKQVLTSAGRIAESGKVEPFTI